ncbi:putative histidine acid phosphatase family protein [Phaeoacremonium minimum UCRPA7]|uniref:Putative histidine acid phosphatase family protein n=1 Tax=Phaeoacremonium minimum (strain UCR-PA7) TaxID=1286976 RepID=R8BM28_PHAM7|nr:putative histidine acid phosphatase family protein [Phaeoacremonium minimum UCRPA7]EOO00330.1 putative histidine acid phosphatase family protein [Phaeoacremonium minimum UCRPA7]
MSQSVDLGWYAPASTLINNLTNVVTAEGVYGFIYDTSDTPASEYGTYNWCNMPHVRKTEYVTPSSDYELAYVELIHRHHKRTPYASNAFPVEPYHWDCNDEGLYYYGQPFDGSGKKAAAAYWQGYISPVNPFVPSGWIGTCQFPQITAPGLDDSWQHGADLYGVYHDLLGFLPDKSDDWRAKVTYRVTNNVITSEVAGMVINGMWDTIDSIPLIIEAAGVDSLEPQYTCSAGSNLFNSIKSSSNAAWAAHLTASTSLYATLDDISGVSTTDSGFHASWDHYYDNLSARQCHAKPLPCKLVNGVNSTTCVTQEQADEVYRFGNWEYSQIYRDAKDSLPASVASYGVWVAELAAHIRSVLDGSSSTIYYHNVAHDGSVSRLLSILQIDVMVWPGMGSEVVFELWKKKPTSTLPTSAPTQTVAPGCSRDNCLRQMIGKPESASAFCPTFTAAAETAVPTWLNNCKGDASRVSSACSCLVQPTATTTSSAATSTATSASGYYVRVLFGGKVLKSSNPSLGLIDLIPVETLLAYFDGLVGENASLIKGKCSS